MSTWSREEVMSTALAARQSLSREYSASSSLRPLAYLFVTSNPNTGEPDRRILVLSADGSCTPESKGRYLVQVKLTALRGKAEATILFLEMRQQEAADRRRLFCIIDYLSEKTDIWQADLVAESLSEWSSVSPERVRLGPSWRILPPA